MDFGAIWAWMGVSENQKTLTFIGVSLVAICTVIWKAYKAITNNKKAAATITQNNQNNSGQQVNIGSVSGGHVKVNQRQSGKL